MRWTATHPDIGHAHHPTAVVHVLLHIHLHTLKDEREGFLCVDDVMEQDNVGMLQVLQQRDFPNGSAGGTFLVFKSDLLQGHQLASDAVWSNVRQITRMTTICLVCNIPAPSFENCCICALQKEVRDRLLNEESACIEMESLHYVTCCCLEFSSVCKQCGII